MTPALLGLLACPVTRAALRFDAAAGELVSDRAGLAFPIRFGVPHLRLDAARPVATEPAPNAPIAAARNPCHP